MPDTDIELKIIPEKEIEEHFEEKPLSLSARLKLNLNEEKLKNIADHCLTKITEIIAERRELEDKIKTYRNQYFGIVRPKSIPYVNAFNVHVHLTKKIVDGAVAQTEEAFEEVDPKWVIPARHKFEYEFRERQEKILDYYSDVCMENRTAWDKVYFNAYLLGNGWIGAPYSRKTEKTIQIAKYNSLDRFLAVYPDGAEKYKNIVNRLVKGETVWLEEKKSHLSSDNPVVEHYEWEDVVVPLDTNLYENDMFVGLNNSPIVARKLSYNWTEIYKLEQQGDFETGVSEKLKYGSEEDREKDKTDPEYLKRPYDCWEVQYFLDIDNDGEDERCLFVFEEKKKLALQAIRYPYNDMRCYIIPVVISHTRSGIYQEGLGEALQPANIVLNAAVNHMLDSSMLANSLTPKVRENTGALEALLNHRWYPGYPLVVKSMDDIQQLTFGTPNLQALLSLFALMERFGEDISGMVNYLLGKESQEDPDAPASKTMALMRKAEIRLRRYINNIKDSINEVGYQAIQRIYQFKSEEELSEILGIDPAQIEMDAPSHFIKPQAQAAGFAVEKMFELRDAMQWLSIMLKEPEIAADPVKRMRLYRKLAKIKGGNWEKLAENIVPTEEELERKQFLRRHLQKKMQVVQKAAQNILQRRGSQEQAMQIGKLAGERYDALNGVSRQELDELQFQMQQQMPAPEKK